MVAGILVILSLLVGTMGLLALVHGSKLAAFFSGQARDGQSVAEAGADQIIATFNQPENRQLLVAQWRGKQRLKAERLTVLVSGQLGTTGVDDRLGELGAQVHLDQTVRGGTAQVVWEGGEGEGLSFDYFKNSMSFFFVERRGGGGARACP
jgi:hypothetical protein